LLFKYGSRRDESHVGFLLLVPAIHQTPPRYSWRRSSKFPLLHSTSSSVYYFDMPYIGSRVLDRELKKGSAELLILSLVEDKPRHGYDIGLLIEQRSNGNLKFSVGSLYPLLYR